MPDRDTPFNIRRYTISSPPLIGFCNDKNGQNYSSVSTRVEDPDNISDPCFDFCDGLDPVGQVGLYRAVALTDGGYICSCVYDGTAPPAPPDATLSNTIGDGSGPIASGENNPDVNDGILCYERNVRSRKMIFHFFVKAFVTHHCISTIVL